MAIKSFLKKDDMMDDDGWIPEAFPLIRGMKGKKIEALQKELKIPMDEHLGLQTEDHIIRLGYSLPLSEEDYKKIVKAEHIKIYEWIIDNINKSGSTFQLDGCLALVNFFKKRKFKKEIPPQTEIEDFAKILEDSISTKRETIHMRNHRDKKSNS